MVLHDIFRSSSGGCEQTAQPRFSLYWDPDDDTTAFNASDELCYNATHDCKLDDLEARAKFWYLNIIHELARHCVGPHNIDFSQFVGKLALDYSPRYIEAIQYISMHPTAWGYSQR